MLNAALELSRAQFGFTLAFHILFPSFSIGLASFLAVLEALWLASGRAAFLALYHFWMKIFALSFGMGVVSGIVMSYEFGTNWSTFVAKTGSVVGPLLAYEVLTAFFLEASFLGVMLFGWKRVGRVFHFASTCIVALGTLISAFWIIAANSWMQYPVAFKILPDGRFVATDWFRVIFSPTFPARFLHMVVGAYLATALAVGAVSAWQLLRGPEQDEARIALRMAILMFAVVAPVQIGLGDWSGTLVADLQPAKLAAIESLWDTKAGQAFHVLAWPDPAAEKNDWSISIPRGASLIVRKDPGATIPGLKSVPRADRPPVAIVFYAFRVMVGLGTLMAALGIWGVVLLIRSVPERSRIFLYSCVAMGPAGFVSVVAGWVVAEVGRQPYVIYGVMRTADAVSPVTRGEVTASLVGFLVVYAVIFSAGILYMLRLFAAEPAATAASPVPRPPGSPLGAVPATGVAASRERSP
jgi:cytochrome d ubiquinol oxidase subunit I